MKNIKTFFCVCALLLGAGQVHAQVPAGFNNMSQQDLQIIGKFDQSFTPVSGFVAKQGRDLGQGSYYLLLAKTDSSAAGENYTSIGITAHDDNRDGQLNWREFTEMMISESLYDGQTSQLHILKLNPKRAMDASAFRTKVYIVNEGVYQKPGVPDGVLETYGVASYDENVEKTGQRLEKAINHFFAPQAR